MPLGGRERVDFGDERLEEGQAGPAIPPGAARLGQILDAARASLQGRLDGVLRNPSAQAHNHGGVRVP